MQIQASWTTTLPCAITFTQAMDIDYGDGTLEQYESHPMAVNVLDGELSVKRNTTVSSFQIFGLRRAAWHWNDIALWSTDL